MFKENEITTSTPKDETPQLFAEKKLRALLSRCLIVVVSCLCFYSFINDYQEKLNTMVPSPSFVSAGLLIIFLIAITALIFGTGNRLHEYGFTLKNWQRALREGFLFTVPIVLLAILAKWIAIKTLPGWHTRPLFDINACINPAIRYTTHGRIIWFETLFLYTLVLAPLQEMIARAGLQGALTLCLPEKNRTLIAILLSSVVFCTIHLGFAIHVVFLSFAASLFWGWLFSRHKTILGTTLSHGMVGATFFWFLGFV